MNEDEMDEEIAKIISEALEQTSHSSCEHSESYCSKDDSDYELWHIHFSTDRCKGLYKMD